MPNRIFYPLHSIAFCDPSVPSGAREMHGIQSVSLNTSFNLEQFFELGQLNIYEQVEDLPSVELTVTKALDGYPIVYHEATRDATGSSLLARTNETAGAVLSIFTDVQENASGVPLRQAFCSGLYINSLSYTLPVQGACTETVSFVGNDKVWKSAAFYFNGTFNGTDEPMDTIQRRQHVIMGAAPTGSIWPSGLPGLSFNQVSGYNVENAGVFGSHIQDVTINTSLGREDLFELGRRRPYYKYATFPTAVTCTINMTPAGFGDEISADSSAEANVFDQPIMIKLSDSTVFDLGTKNKLQSVTYSGGDATGGNVQTSYTFQNFNILKITHDEDPAGF